MLLLADLGLAVIGTLVSAIAVHTRARDLIGPLIGAAAADPGADRHGPRRGAAAGRRTAPASVPAKWLAVLALYDVVFALLAYAVFDFLLED